MKKLILLLLVLMVAKAQAQKIDSIFFDLYTDSLKKGVYNYINVVGKMTDKSFYPLMENELEFGSNAGRWQGNSLFLDSSYCADSVVVTAHVKNNPTLAARKIIYLKKNLYEPPLKTEKELMEEWQRKQPRN